METWVNGKMNHAGGEIGAQQRVREVEMIEKSERDKNEREHASEESSQEPSLLSLCLSLFSIAYSFPLSLFFLSF